MFNSPFMEALDCRRMFSVSVKVVDGILRIIGDGQENEIEVASFDQVNLVVLVDGNTVGSAILIDSLDRIRIEGGGGEDSLDSDETGLPTIIKGGSGGDQIYCNNTINFIDGGKGADSITFYGGVFLGGPGNDTLQSYGEDAWVLGQGGDDELGGFYANDTLIGGSGDDRAASGEGNDVIFGGSGSDTLAGGGGKDKMYGNAGGDSILADSSGDDTIFGGAGQDTLDANGGGKKNIHNGEKSNIDDIVADLFDETNEFLDEIGVDPIEA